MLVVCFRLTKKSIRAQRANFVPKNPWKTPATRRLVKRGQFEVLQIKTSYMPRVVWLRNPKLVSDSKLNLGSKNTSLVNFCLTGNPAVSQLSQKYYNT